MAARGMDLGTALDIARMRERDVFHVWEVRAQLPLLGGVQEKWFVRARDQYEAMCRVQVEHKTILSEAHVLLAPEGTEPDLEVN